MAFSSVKENSEHQKGIALLIFVIMVVLGSITYYLTGLSVEDIKLYKTKSTAQSLQQAKQALLAYAAAYSDLDADSDGNADFPGEFGFLPCPDYNGGLDEGLEDNGSCGATAISKLGYLPWRTLGIAPFKGDGGACLLYAVSGEYKNDEAAATNKSLMLNEDSNGMFQIADVANNPIVGINPDERLVAIIFAPGESLPGQARNVVAGTLCNNEYLNVHAYLDAAGSVNNSSLQGVADSLDTFLHARPGSDQLAVTPYNDTFVTITRKELWDAVISRPDFSANADSIIRRQTEALAKCLAAYANNSGNRKLPRPADIDFAGGDYRIDGNYSDSAAASFLGRYPFTVANSDALLGVANAPNNAQPILFDKSLLGIGFCDALVVAGGPEINLNTGTQAEGYMLWKNWKDHFFYAVSDYYAPTGAVDTGAPGCNGTNCLGVGGTEYAAVVIYAGSRAGISTRNEPLPLAGDVDTKKTLTNYLEVTNPVGNGKGDYTPTDNDIMYCIRDTDPLKVVSCP
ncbi:MAG: hypothetical protein QNL62_21815 [Gammaproteobacteria bacterium]|nr:hypothetical protein [Gammaproteobacteria bacterium]